MSGKAHRGVLTSAPPSHLCDQGRLDDYFKRWHSRVTAMLNRGERRAQTRLRKIDYNPEELHLIRRGLRQPSCGSVPKEG